VLRPSQGAAASVRRPQAPRLVGHRALAAAECALGSPDEQLLPELVPPVPRSESVSASVPKRPARRRRASCCSRRRPRNLRTVADSQTATIDAPAKTSTAMTAVKNIVNATPSLRLNSPTRTQKAQMRPTSTRLTRRPSRPGAPRGWPTRRSRASGVRRRLAAYRVGVGTGRWFVVDGHRVDSTARAWVFPLRVRLRRRGVAESVV
jgi:hypothetical protein